MSVDANVDEDTTGATESVFYSLEGRLNREPYIAWTLGLAFCGGILYVLATIAFNSAAQSYNASEAEGYDLVGWLFTLSGIVTAISALFPIAKRLHDVDLSGGWALVGLIPFIGTIFLIVLAFLPGTRGINKFGPEPVRPELHSETGPKEARGTTVENGTEDSLRKLRDLRERQLISEEVYQEKQREILARL